MHFHRLPLARALAIVLCAVSLPPVAAQTAPPRDPAAASRVLRDAENPMRMIIEASKLRPRGKAASPEGPVPEKRPVPAPKPMAATAAAPVAASAATATSVSATVSQPPPAAAPEVDVAASAPVAQAVAKAAESAPVVVASPAPAGPALPLKPLKLKQLVEPSLPGSVLRRMRSDVEVVVGFTVNADGTVSDVLIRSNPMKALDEAVLEAVTQWRYEPIQQARAHAVQLVLRASP